MSTTHYVNNKELYNAMCEYIALVRQARQEGKARPEVPPYIAKCIMNIAVRRASSYNYINNRHYSDEMIMDGVENCLRYIHNFDPDKSNNPFSYFTQCINNAFNRRIEQEKKEDYIKHKYTRHSAVLYGLESASADDEGTVCVMDNEAVSDFLTSFEQHMERKKAKRKQNKKLVEQSPLDELGSNLDDEIFKE